MQYEGCFADNVVLAELLWALTPTDEGHAFPLNYIVRKSQAYLLAAYLHVLNVDSKKRLFLWLLSIYDCNVS